MAESWLCDLVAERVVVYRAPVDGRYRAVRMVGRGEALAPHAFADVSVTVQDLLGPKM